jgi:hypothetical protein
VCYFEKEEATETMTYTIEVRPGVKETVEVLDRDTDNCPDCEHPLNVHSSSGFREGHRRVHSCCATVFVYHPMTDVVDFTHPCICTGPKEVRV